MHRSAIYNFPDPGRVLLSKTVGNIFWEVATGLPVKWLVSLAGVSDLTSTRKLTLVQNMH